ncbi:MAG: serine O-acetyltransferase, partial [Nitrospira sp.]|nr:serine O-acetyltransferase [Nitrospira sp.]
MFQTISQDLQAIFDRDPAATSRLEVILTYAGFHALLAYR